MPDFYTPFDETSLYGVTFTDLLQAGVVIFAAGYISILAFTTVDIGTMVNIPSGWQSIIPPWHMNMPPRL